MNITWKGSPNYDLNRRPIDRIVIHWFGAGTLESAHTTFQKDGGTSAHYGISDKTVWQWVKEEDVAYHAGNYEMNQRSIGIEHDANPQKQASEDTYKTSIELVTNLCKKYTIPADRVHIIRHGEIKATQCCGTIDVDRIVAEVKKNLETPVKPIEQVSTTVSDVLSALSSAYGFTETKRLDELVGHIQDRKNHIIALEAQIQEKPKEIIREIIKEVPVEKIVEVPVEKIVTIDHIHEPFFTIGISKFLYGLAKAIEPEAITQERGPKEPENTGKDNG